MSKPNLNQIEPAPEAAPDSRPCPADPAAVALAGKIKELLRLAQEQGQLTFEDVNEVLTEEYSTPAHLDQVFAKLRELEIEVVDAAELDRVKPANADDLDEEEARFDSLDDPVRMYLKQMGAVPLLTREQEVAISKRIEAAETELRRVVYRFGFTGKEHLALAEKLLADPPRERFDRVVLDKKIASREAHLKLLQRLSLRVRQMDQEVDRHFNLWRDAQQEAKRNREHEEFEQRDRKLQALFPKFCFKQKVIEESMQVAQNIHHKMLLQPACARRSPDPARVRPPKSTWPRPNNRRCGLWRNLSACRTRISCRRLTG